MVEKNGQPHLAVQDAATVDASKLTALTPEVVSTNNYIMCAALCFAFVWCTAAYLN